MEDFHRERERDPHVLDAIEEENDDDLQALQALESDRAQADHWDPTKPHLWLAKVNSRRQDMVRVSNLARSLGKSYADAADEEQGEEGEGARALTAAERVEAARLEMEEEKRKAKEDARMKRLAGPQPLIPGVISNCEETAFTVVMITVTIFSLWGVDSYYSLIDNPLDNDLAFYTAVLICFAFFALEFLFYTFFKPGYCGSFFFYLDFISSISLVPDLLLLFDIQAFGDPGDTGASEGGGGQTTIARAGRAARAGTRAARIVRVFKALTLIKKSKNQGGKPESYVGQLVNDGIQRKIIIIVATMLVVSEVLLMIEDEEQFKRTTTDLRTELVSFQLLLQIAGGNVRAEPFASNMVGRTYLLH